MQGVCYTTGVVGGLVDEVVEGVYPHPILVQVGGGEDLGRSCVAKVAERDSLTSLVVEE
jgi:hypothetical protein